MNAYVIKLSRPGCYAGHHFHWEQALERAIPFPSEADAHDYARGILGLDAHRYEIEAVYVKRAHVAA